MRDYALIKRGSKEICKTCRHAIFKKPTSYQKERDDAGFETPKEKYSTMACLDCTVVVDALRGDSVSCVVARSDEYVNNCGPNGIYWEPRSD